MTKTEVSSVAQWLGWFLFKRKNIESNFPQFSHSDVVVDVVLVVVDCSILILVRVKKIKITIHHIIIIRGDFCYSQCDDDDETHNVIIELLFYSSHTMTTTTPI